MTLASETALSLHKKFVDGSLSAEEILRFYLHRIEAHDKELHSFLRTFPDQAMERARLLDQKRALGKPLGKLAGVPIALKDNIHMKGEISSCASKFLENYKAPFHATVTENLLSEDAVIMGKTNLDEFAMGSTTEHSAFCQTRNPWNTACVPGGSSGGSGVAVSARFCPLSLGSDTGGSIRLPAAFCGITGFKPTYGRVSRYGLVAYGSSLDQIGPFGTTVEDIAYVLEVLARPCNRDSTSISTPPENYLELLKKEIGPLKIGVPKKFLEDLADEPRQNFEEALDVYKQLGAQLVEVDLDILKYSIATYYILATAEASTNLARFDGIRYGIRSSKAKTLDEVYDFSKDEGFGKEVKRRILLGTYVLSAGYQDAYYKKAQKMRTLIIRQFEAAFKQCDVVALPPSSSDAFELGSIQDPLQMYLADIFTIPANLAGLPCISIPSGFSKRHLPYGLQLMAPQQKDGYLLQVAHTFQKNTDFHLAMPPIAKKEGSK